MTKYKDVDKSYTRCIGTVMDRDGWSSHQCTNRGKHHEEGRWWCGIHAPSKVKARRLKSELAFDLQWQESKLKQEIVTRALRADSKKLPKDLREVVEQYRELISGESDA